MRETNRIEAGPSPESMLDLERIRRIELTDDPIGQKIIAGGLLAPNYELYPGVDIDVEGLERIPDEPVLYAMNHTDRYNYWPFQYALWRRGPRYTATWVKGKYYQHPALAWVMEKTNNIPTVSRGYLIARDFLNVVGRPPEDEEYRTLRSLVDSVAYGRPERRPEPERIRAIPTPVFEASRSLLGLEYRPARHGYPDRLNELFVAMMDRFTALNEEAFELGLDVLVFPEGTRSKRLKEGKIGLAQIALHTGRPVVPVGCNGSDRVYTGDAPFARSGEIVYRVGEPVGRGALEAYDVGGSFDPFTPAAERAHREAFRELTDAVMKRIDGLLDPAYRSAEDDAEAGGASRFV